MENEFNDESKLIISIVNKGYASEVVSEARKVGSKGAVILTGKGTALSDKKFFGFNVSPEKELILILVKTEIALPVLKAIYAKVDVMSDAGGVVMAIPVSYSAGFIENNELEIKE
ncbi:MAG: P-II family nitrogen regulator [Clostridia bacterium]